MKDAAIPGNGALRASAALCAAALSWSAPAAAQPQSLDALLNLVKQGRAQEARENEARERRFAAELNNRQRLLREAKEENAALDRESTRLSKRFEANKRDIGGLKSRLDERLGTLKEMFGHLTSAAGDLRATLETSLVSAQYPGREAFLTSLIEKTSQSDELPSIEDFERLWSEMLQEMIESGKTVKFDARFALPSGEARQGAVVRVGSFNAVTDQGQYLSYDNGSLVQLERQPSGPYNGWAEDLAGAAGEGYTPLGVDPTGPTGGSFLAALIDSPTLVERWRQGGIIGYVITAVGVFSILLATWRCAVLTGVSGKVKRQLANDVASDDNPLGRVLAAYQENVADNVQALETKIDEAVLKELPRLQTGEALLKIIAGVAPLMGLLGTVTGMILTFQGIVIFGAGDPKAMAGGISQALVTTVLGLLVAIPTILLHTVVSLRSRGIIQILEERAAGIIAERSERQAA